MATIGDFHPAQNGASCPALTTVAVFVVMYYYHPRLLAKSNIEKQNTSHRVNDVCNGSPSRIRRVLLISLGMTILPRSSTRRTMPVAFIILFSFEARDARFAPVEVFAGKGELCMGAAAIFFSGAETVNVGSLFAYAFAAVPIAHKQHTHAISRWERNVFFA